MRSSVVNSITARWRSSDDRPAIKEHDYVLLTSSVNVIWKINWSRKQVHVNTHILHSSTEVINYLYGLFIVIAATLRVAVPWVLLWCAIFVCTLSTLYTQCYTLRDIQSQLANRTLRKYNKQTFSGSLLIF